LIVSSFDSISSSSGFVMFSFLCVVGFGVGNVGWGCWFIVGSVVKKFGVCIVWYGVVCVVFDRSSCSWKYWSMLSFVFGYVGWVSWFSVSSVFSCSKIFFPNILIVNLFGVFLY